MESLTTNPRVRGQSGPEAELEDITMAEGSETQAARRRQWQEQLLWDTRIYEEREKSLTFICEQPALLEQRIFTLAREIMMRLE